MTAPNPYEHLRACLQYLLDCEGDGWLLTDYVAVVGLRRITSDGYVESTSWTIHPHEQADYITDGLLTAAEDMRARCTFTDDD